MLDGLIETDKALMVSLNLSGSHSAFLDTFMWLTSQIWVWLPLYACLLFVTVRRKKKEAVSIVLFVALAVVLCDQTASGLLKPLVGRLRPSHDPSIMDMLSYVGDYRGGRYGFPSSHASNCFGIALFFTLLLKDKVAGVFLFMWATITAYSRIYLGVHYPTDIVVGASIGLLMGGLCYILYSRTRTGVLRRWANEAHFVRQDGIIVVAVIVATFVAFAVAGIVEDPLRLPL